ncbi:MAG: hypothetical protein KBE09_01525 [Candidatus Pacebacteria bacterium]|nr:hypothetical protein [Candidatus Paceibacterota bacterium]
MSDIADSPVTTGSVQLSLSYGPTTQSFDAVGRTVEDFLGDQDVADVMGYNEPWKGSVLVNGKAAGRTYVIQPGDNIEVIKQAGDKG